MVFGPFAWTGSWQELHTRNYRGLAWNFDPNAMGPLQYPKIVKHVKKSENRWRPKIWRSGPPPSSKNVEQGTSINVPASRSSNSKLFWGIGGKVIQPILGYREVGYWGIGGGGVLRYRVSNVSKSIKISNHMLLYHSEGHQGENEVDLFT